MYRGVYDILGFNDGKNWDDVRRELSNDQIVDIHQLYWALWPIKTDIFSLLPRPDETLRIVYTGVLDPRTIFEALQRRALEEGLPYQSLVSSVLHKYVSGGLKDITAQKAISRTNR